ncbi:MAG: PID-CTERM protein-sorting domain-containing protein [Janthinobacterium lividum]
MNKLVLTAALLSITAIGYAQAPGGSTGSGGPQPTAVPLDGGSSLLLASGVAYGLRRLQQRRALRKAN